MEIKHLFIPLSNWLHFSVRLISYAMVDVFQIWYWHNFVERLFAMVCSEAWEEWASVVDSLNKCVDGITVGSYRRNYHLSVLVF